MGISIKGEKDHSVRDLWQFLLRCTFSDFFFSFFGCLAWISAFCGRGKN